MATLRWHRAGAAVLVAFALGGVATAAYVLASGLDPPTPGWARGISLGFPLAASAAFVWYLLRYGGTDGGLYRRYAGIGCGLGGVAFVSPGVGMVVQQELVGSPVLNAEVFLVESLLGGGLVGLATGHFYAVLQAERGRLDRRRVDLERRRQQLAVLNRVLRHDVRNRLNVVLSAAASLADGDPDREPLERIEESVAEITEISETARRIEAVTRAGSDGREPADLVPVVEAAVERIRSRFPDAVVRTDLPEAAELASNGLLESAVANLVENAVEHNDAETPRVEIAVRVPDDADRVELRIADDGPGFPEHERIVLEGDRETSLRHSSGLGLWLVRWIVEDLGGELRVGDRQPRGTVVTVELPRTRAEMEAVAG